MGVCVYNVVGKKKLLANLTVKRTQTQVCVCVFVCVCVCVCVCVFVAKTTNKFCTRYVTNMREIIFAILTILIFVSSLHDIIFQVFSSPFLIVEYLPIVCPLPPLFHFKALLYTLGSNALCFRTLTHAIMHTRISTKR